MPAPTSVVQQLQLHVAAAASISGNFASNPASTSVVAVAFMHDTSTVPTVTGCGGTWVRYAASGGGQFNWDYFICANPSGSAKNVVVTCGGSTRILALAQEIAGVDQTNPFDRVAHTFNPANTGAQPNESVIPLFANAGVFVFLFGADAGSGGGGTAGGFTQLTGTSSAGGLGSMFAAGSYRLSTPAVAGVDVTTLLGNAIAGGTTISVPVTQAAGPNDPSTGQPTFYPVPVIFGTGGVNSGDTVIVGAGGAHPEIVAVSRPPAGYGLNLPPAVNVSPPLVYNHSAGERITKPLSYGTSWLQAVRSPWGGFAVSLRGAPLAALNLSMTMAGSSSMSAVLPTSNAPLPTDIVEFALLDGGTLAQLAILSNASNGSWLDSFNDAGSGTFDLPVADPKSALIATGHAVSCRLNGLERFRYWLDAPAKAVAPPSGQAGELWTCAGRGWEVYLERGELYPTTFGTGQLTSVPVGGFAGAILTGLIGAMQTRGAIPRVTWDFSETYDSSGNAWTKPLYLTINVGDNLLAIVNQLRSFGIAVRLRPDFVLQAWELANAGRHLETSVVLHEGYHFAGAPSIPYLQPSSQLRTRMVVEGDNGVMVETFNATLEAIPRVGRREGYVRVSGVTDPGTLKAAGDQAILNSQTATESITVPLYHGGNYDAYTHFAAGDWIAINAVGTWDRVAYRVAGLTIAQVEAGGHQASPVLASLPADPFLDLVTKVAALG